MPDGTLIHVDPRDELRVGAGFADERPPFDRRDRVMFVSADHQIDVRILLDERAVVSKRKMRDGDDDGGAGLFQHGQVPACRRQRIENPRVLQLVARDFLRVQAQADESHLQRAERLDEIRRRAADRLPRFRVDDIGDDPLKRRLLHALDQHVVAEVELVVAERRQIEAGGVQRGDHMLASEDARGDRGSQEVSGDDEEWRAAGLRQVLFQRRDARQASLAVDRHCRVDVVDLDKRDRRGGAGREFLLGRRGNERDDKRRSEERRNDEPRTPNRERRTANSERRTPNRERRTTNVERRTSHLY